jgi:transcriptional regulator with GAF, ATPase, and Fis domain
MVKINCAALPAALMESELFGSEKGAYTGAVSTRVGRFEVADGSTLFLDEIGELPVELQAKLLRVLQEGQFERLGSNETRTVDVRIIAATNRNLEEEMREGRFREDLYWRLSVFPIIVPPLRERTGDIPLLAWAFVKRFEKQMGIEIDTIPRRPMEELERYPWPGNIRELRNVIEHAMIISDGPVLRLQAPAASESAASLDMTLEGAERNHIRQVLERTNWRIRGKNGAAEILGLKPSTLYSRLKKLGIEREGRPAR